MPVTFRAELMPGRDRHQRTFVVKELLLVDVFHCKALMANTPRKEFEPVHLDRPVA